MSRGRFCNLCGQALNRHRDHLQGEVAGLVVCSACESRVIRCAVCQRVMLAEHGAKICAACRSLLPTCTACGKPVIGQGYHRLGREELYCEDCFRYRERCAVCGVPIVGNSGTLHDGSPVCCVCSSTAIHDLTIATQIFEKVIAITHQHLQLHVHNLPGFLLVGRQQLDAIVDQVQRTSLPGGNEGHLLGVYMKHGHRREILVESGLPQLLMTKVIAHEYGHAWQGENCPFLREPIMIEGFCEWVSYKVLGILGAVKEQQRLIGAPGFYGEGLRMVLSLEGTQGPQKLLEQIKIIR